MSETGSSQSTTTGQSLGEILQMKGDALKEAITKLHKRATVAENDLASERTKNGQLSERNAELARRSDTNLSDTFLAEQLALRLQRVFGQALTQEDRSYTDVTENGKTGSRLTFTYDSKGYTTTYLPATGDLTVVDKTGVRAPFTLVLDKFNGVPTDHEFMALLLWVLADNSKTALKSRLPESTHDLMYGQKTGTDHVPGCGDPNCPACGAMSSILESYLGQVGTHFSPGPFTFDLGYGARPPWSPEV